MDLSGKIALVTGGGRGIGKGCALELARCGADIVVNDRPGSPDLAATASEIAALGGRCVPLEANAFSRKGCEELVEMALSEMGQIDILISNPAYGKRANYLDITPEEFDKVIDATFKAGFHMSQLIGRHMVERGGGGKIVFISSVVAEMPFARNAAYGAAKAALNHLMHFAAVELNRHRINVNAIEPGWIDTPGERATFSEAVIVEQSRKMPWGRMGTPEDIGKAAAFLASDEADYITGVVLPVDGGFRFKDFRAEEQPPELNP